MGCRWEVGGGGGGHTQSAQSPLLLGIPLWAFLLPSPKSHKAGRSPGPGRFYQTLDSKGPPEDQGLLDVFSKVPPSASPALPDWAPGRGPRGCRNHIPFGGW